jgi:hypothetical protein
VGCSNAVGQFVHAVGALAVRVSGVIAPRNPTGLAVETASSNEHDVLLVAPPPTGEATGHIQCGRAGGGQRQWLHGYWPHREWSRRTARSAAGGMLWVTAVAVARQSSPQNGSRFGASFQMVGGSLQMARPQSAQLRGGRLVMWVSFG